MRLWSVHPKYLDAKGLVALWREGLLAQAVLLGNTKGYKNHSQLERFKTSSDPLASISYYLDQVVDEATYGRNYSFDHTKIVSIDKDAPLIKVTRGQLEYEFNHLIEKLKKRDPERIANIPRVFTQEDVHPLFLLVDGEIESWEKI